MKAIGLTDFGAPDVLRAVELPEPHAGAGEIRIRVKAAGVNPADLLLRSGPQAAMLSGQPKPYVPGQDVAGTVDEIGPGTDTSVTIGDDVMAMLIPIGPGMTGGYAEYVVLPAAWVVASPRGMSAIEAATIPMNGLTALLALDTLDLQPGSTLAVVGAAGGLGGYITGLAAAKGLSVIADAAPRDADLVRRLGAAEVVERGAGIAARIRQIHPLGVDAAADTAMYGPALFDAVRDGGQFARFRSTDEPGSYAAVPGRGVRLQTPFVPDYAGRTDKLDEVRALAEAGALTPRIAEVYPAEDAARAHERLERGGVRGRLVLTFP